MKKINFLSSRKGNHFPPLLFLENRFPYVTVSNNGRLENHFSGKPFSTWPNTTLVWSHLDGILGDLNIDSHIFSNTHISREVDLKRHKAFGEYFIELKSSKHIQK